MTDERTPAQGEWEGAIEAVIAAARNMPRSTTKAGCASDEHEYKIGSWAVWALDRALKQLDAIRALRPAARAVGDYVLVPREPTAGMMEAAKERIITTNEKTVMGRTADIYRAMLAAAPPAQEATTEVVELRTQLEELEATFDLRWKADMRAIKRWREAHPGNDLVLPDHADLVVWLLRRQDQREW